MYLHLLKFYIFCQLRYDLSAFWTFSSWTWARGAAACGLAACCKRFGPTAASLLSEKSNDTYSMSECSKVSNYTIKSNSGCHLWLFFFLYKGQHRVSKNLLNIPTKSLHWQHCFPSCCKLDGVESRDCMLSCDSTQALV